MKRRQGAVVLFMLLFIFWVVLSSKITLIQLIVGFFASLLVVFYNYDLVFNDLEATKITFKFIGRLIHLFIVLLIEIVKSNIHVMMIVLSPKMKINPGFKKIKQPLKKEFNQALFANAITLTPGTLTVDMDDEFILVHGLEMENIDDIEMNTVTSRDENIGFIERFVVTLNVLNRRYERSIIQADALIYTISMLIILIFMFIFNVF